MKRRLLLILIANILLFVLGFTCSEIKCYSPRTEGPFFYLWFVSEAMREFHEDNGFYPSDFDALNPYIKCEEETKGVGFTYKIVHADKNRFLVISQNMVGLRDYQITENSFIPTWFFKEDKERKKNLKELIDIVEQYKHYANQGWDEKDKERKLFWRALYDLRNFDYDDVGNYLFNLIQKDDSCTIADDAGEVLSLTILHPSKDIVKKLAQLKEDKLCLIISCGGRGVLKMLIRANEKEAIGAAILLLEWIITNCESDKKSPFSKEVIESKSELEEKLSQKK